MCKDMQIPNLGNLAIPDRITRYNKVISHGIEFPIEHHQNITKYVLSHLSTNGQATAWANGLKVRVVGVVPDWDINKPMFASCMPKSKEESEATKFKETYHNTVFCPGFMRHVQRACQGTPCSSFVSLCQVVRSSLEPEDEDENPMEAWLLDIVDPVRKMCKAFIALLSPVPLLGGSRIDHVKYLFPDDGKSSLFVRQAGKHGRQIQSKVRESGCLRGKKEAFAKKAGIEAQHGEPLLELHLRAEAAASSLGVTDSTPTEPESMYQNFTENANWWHKSFRANCTRELQHNLVKLLQGDVQNVMDSTDPDLDKARLYYNTLLLITVVGAEELRQRISGVLSTWQEAASQATILQKAEALLSTKCPVELCGCVIAFHEALTTSQDTEIKAEDAPKVLQALADIVAWTRDKASVSHWFAAYKLSQDVIGLQGCWLPEPHRQSSINLCQGVVRLFGGCVAVQEAVSKWDRTDPGKTDPETLDRSATEDIVSHLMQEVVKMLHTANLVHEVPDVFNTDDLRPEWEAVVANVRKMTMELKDEDATDVVRKYTKGLQIEVNKALHFLQQVCKGGNGGTHWYDNLRGDLATHFNTTLKTADTKKIISLRDDVKQVCSLV